MIGVTNVPVGDFLHKILYMISPLGYKNLPILDRTGSDERIDVPTGMVDFSNFKAVKDTLENLGFKVEKIYGEFNAIIITDRKFQD